MRFWVSAFISMFVDFRTSWKRFACEVKLNALTEKTA